MAFANGYLFRAAISFDHTQAGSTDSANIALVIKPLLTAPTGDLATIANGGQINNLVTVNGVSVPADLKFSSDSADTIPIPWEIASYDPVTGAAEIWVQVPTLKRLAPDTVIYMWYGNAAVVTYQCTYTDVWDANYGGVWHCGNGAAVGLAESTVNANTLTNHGATAAAGVVGGADSVAQASAQYLDAGSSATIDFGGASFTMECWAKFTGTPTNGVYPHLISCVDALGLNGWELIASAPNDGAPNRMFITLYKLGVFLGGLAAGPINGLTVGTWFHYAFQYNNATGVGHLFINAVIQTTLVTSTANAVGAPTVPMSFGRWAGGGTHYWDGPMDEIRISKNVVRTDDYLLASYNNQKNGSTFTTVAAPVTDASLFVAQLMAETLATGAAGAPTGIVSQVIAEILASPGSAVTPGGTTGRWFGDLMDCYDGCDEREQI